MDVNVVNGSSATNKGTKIVRDSKELDKNAFLKILVAEMSNQDPTAPKDSTQYIAQMAQFSSVQELSNLNSGVTFSGATALIGKAVMLDAKDNQGLNYCGIVKGVVKDGSRIQVNVAIGTDKEGKAVMKAFDYDDVTEIASI